MIGLAHSRHFVRLTVATLALASLACHSRAPLAAVPEPRPAAKTEPQDSLNAAEIARLQEERLESVAVRPDGAQLAALPLEGETPESLLTATPVSPLGAGREVVYAIESLRFPVGARSLDPGSREVLDQIADRLALGDERFVLEIQGHADGSGPEFENERLARLRAEAVRGYLLERTGLPEDRAAVVALGSTRPIGDDATELGRALNRRVSVLVLR